ncbi:MAG: hypothetical protein IPK20_09475 [Betaproteobacteria bacterium]|nr:hypothetical protein [Betaproteobacteria bacterium]
MNGNKYNETVMREEERNTPAQAHSSISSTPCIGWMGLALLLFDLSGTAGCGVLSRPPKPDTRPHPLGDTYGQKYDLEKYKACTRADPGSGNCLLFKLRRNENPELWPYPDVPPMKWPEPPVESVYREGMTPVEYWRALCKAEAGEFIYRTVEDVDGLYQIRPRKHETLQQMADRYVVEDPYGTTNAEEETQQIFFSYVLPPEKWHLDRKGYSYIESAPLDLDAKLPISGYDKSLQVPRPDGARFERYFGYRRRYMSDLKMEWDVRLLSRYGFTWRGIRRPKDRELAVAGGELAVVDLKTNEIVGIRRGFVLAGQSKDGTLWWDSPNACPEYSAIEGIGKRLGRNRSLEFGLWFLTKVARPSGRPYPP